jgi:hypothetical protein
MGFFNKEMNGKCMKMMRQILSPEQIDVLFDNDLPLMKRLIDLFAGIDNNFYKGILKIILIEEQKHLDLGYCTSLYETLIKENKQILDKLIKGSQDQEFYEKVDKHTQRFMMGAMFGLMSGNIESVGGQFRRSLEQLSSEFEL